MKLSYLLAGIAAAVLSCSAMAIKPGHSTTVDFSDGTDDWFGRVGVPASGTTTWDTSLGNSAPSLHTKYNDFLKVGLRYYTDDSVFTGDYTQAQSITLSLDVNPIRMEVGASGAAVGKDIYLDLIDYDNPADGYDSSFVSFKLGTLTEGTGWQTLSVTLNTTGSSTLPDGWTAVDANGEPTMAAGMTFAQLLAGIDEIAFRIPPTRSGGALTYDVAVDNISISSVAAVPEPASALLLLTGVLALGGLRRARGSKR